MNSADWWICAECGAVIPFEAERIVATDGVVCSTDCLQRRRAEYPHAPKETT